MSYKSAKSSNYIGQTEDTKLKDYLVSVDNDLTSLFRMSSPSYQFGSGANFSVLTYTSSNFQWFSTVGGWSITNTLLYGGTGSQYIGLQPGVGIWMGDPAFATSVFSVDPTGQMKAHAGRLGGWYIGTTTLSSTNLVFDSDNERIESADFVSGALGTGWRIEKNVAEFNNIRARGKITTSVFEKESISSVGGNLLISDSDLLNADMTAADTSTMTVLGTSIFSINDVLRIKDGTSDEWFTITGSTSSLGYTVTRDQAGDYGANANPVWTKGTAVVNYGANGKGGIQLSSSEPHSPYIHFYTHSSSPWTTIYGKVRIGNLNGVAGCSGYGIWGGAGFLGALQVIDIIKIGSSGAIRSNIASQYPYLEFSNQGLQLKDSDTGGTYGTALYSTDKYGYGALAWVMNSNLKIPWVELKEPSDASGTLASLRLFNRNNTPTGLSFIGDISVVNGKLYICTTTGSSPDSVWTLVGSQS